MKKLIILLLLSTTLFAQPTVFKHKVQRGETLFGISRQYNVTIQALKEENLVLKNGLQIGQTLSIPARRQIVVGLDSLQSRVIAIELSDCEFTKKELSLMEKILQKTEDSGKIKDKLVQNVDEQVKTVNKIAETNQELFTNCQKDKDILQKNLKSKDIRNGVNKFIYFIIGVGTSYLLLK